MAPDRTCRYKMLYFWGRQLFFYRLMNYILGIRLNYLDSPSEWVGFTRCKTEIVEISRPSVVFDRNPSRNLTDIQTYRHIDDLKHTLFGELSIACMSCIRIYGHGRTNKYINIMSIVVRSARGIT